MVISVSVFYPILLLSSGPLGVGPDTQLVQLVPTTADTFMSAGGVISYDELTTRPNAYPTHAIRAAHLPSGSNEVGTAYRLQKEILVPYQTVQGPTHIVDEEATAAMESEFKIDYIDDPGRSTSNHHLKQKNHDGEMWNTTYISPAGTAVLAQSDGSARLHPARQTTVRSKAPRRRVRPERLLSPIDIIANAGSECNYIDKKDRGRTNRDVPTDHYQHRGENAACQQIQDTLPTLPVPEPNLLLREAGGPR